MSKIKDAFFTIVMPTYNRSGFITRAIQSVLGQQFISWELLIVDDGSTDDTEREVKNFTDERILYLHQQNTERSAARNHGIKKATGKYICFLDDDDEYLSNHLQILYEFISKKKFPLALFFTDTLWNGKPSGAIVDEILLKNKPAEFFLQSPIGNPRVCVHADILLKYKFDEAINIGEDIFLWIPISLHYPVYHVAKTTVNCSKHEMRSVNLSRPVFPPLISNFHKFFSQYHDEAIISKKVKNEILSNCYHRKANFYYLKKSFLPMINCLLYSFYLHPYSRQNKTKLYLIKSYLFGPVISNFE